MLKGFSTPPERDDLAKLVKNLEAVVIASNLRLGEVTAERDLAITQVKSLGATIVDKDRIITAQRINESWYANKIIGVQDELRQQKESVCNLLEAAKAHRAGTNRDESTIKAEKALKESQDAFFRMADELTDMTQNYKDASAEALKFKNKWEDQKGWVVFANSQREETVEKYVALLKEWELDQETIRELNRDYDDLNFAYDVLLSESKKTIKKLVKKAKRVSRGKSPRLKKALTKKAPQTNIWDAGNQKPGPSVGMDKW